MVFNNIEGINDRRNLFLLLYKENRSASDAKKLDKLKEWYPDYDEPKYLKVHDDLYAKKFIQSIDLRPDLPLQSDSGFYIDYTEQGIEKSKTVTTKSGETALKNKYYKSELSEQTRKKRLSLLDSAFKWIAIIGGILGFISFFR